MKTRRSRRAVFAACRWGVAAALLLGGCATPPAPVVVEKPPPEPVFIPPRVMVMITANGPESVSAKAAESHMVNQLVRAGFPVVDASVLHANQQKIKAYLDSAGDVAGAARIGLEAGADVVIRGHADARMLASKIASSKLEAYQGESTLQAILTDNGELLATASEAASVMALDAVSGGNKAVQSASARAMDQLIASMRTSWRNYTDTAHDSGAQAATRLSLSASTRESVGDESDAIPKAPDGYQAPLAAIWRLTPQAGVPEEWMGPTTEKLSASILGSGWFRLVTREDMEKILAEHSVQMSDACNNTEQAVEYGKILSTSHIIIGSASRIGQTFQIVLKIVNVESGEIERAGQSEGRGSPDIMLRLVDAAAARLFTAYADGKENGETTQ